MEDQPEKMRMTRRGLRLAALLIVFVPACHPDSNRAPAEIQPLARIELDSNRVVEIIGLRRWSAEQLRDSLNARLPDEGIESDGTAANLRNVLGFADAAASIHSVVFDEDERSTITLAVREPGDSARVKYAPQSLDTIPRRAEWHWLSAAMTADTTGRLLQIVAG